MGMCNVPNNISTLIKSGKCLALSKKTSRNHLSCTEGKRAKENCAIVLIGFENC